MTAHSQADSLVPGEHPQRPVPDIEGGFPRVLMLGATGAGKSNRGAPTVGHGPCLGGVSRHLQVPDDSGRHRGGAPPG